MRFFGFEGPVRDMDTQKVVLRVHLAKVHVLYRKSIVFVHSSGQNVCFHGRIWSQWGCRVAIEPPGRLRFGGGKVRFFGFEGSIRDLGRGTLR